MFKRIITLSLLFVMVGCGKQQDVTVSESYSFEDSIVSVCDDKEVLGSVYSKFEELDIPDPCELYGDNCTFEDGVFRLDTLNKEQKVVHLVTKQENGEWVTDYSYDVPEEAKAEIVRVLQNMIGPDVDVKISKTYKDYVNVKAQGRNYRWKDGVLELSD